MIDIRTEIRAAFEKEQSAFPPPAALRAQVVAAVSARDRAAPTRQRTAPDMNWLMVAAAALLAIAIVAGLMAVRLMSLHPQVVKPGPAPQLCVPGATQPANRFAQVHGCITYIDGTQIVAVDPFHPANRIVLGPSNGQLPIAWSRDGSRLLLISLTDLYVMNPDGSEVRITHGDVIGWEASISPDGTKVVYDRYQDKVTPGVSARTTGLYVVDVKGGAPRLIADSNFCSVVPSNVNGTIVQGPCDQSRTDSSLTYPAWSPDGSRIAYVDHRYYLSIDEVWTMKSDGTDQRRLVGFAQCVGNQPSGCTNGLAWSPDGSQLAIHSTAGIYTVRTDGSGLHLISKEGVQPSWSPDGSRIAFTRGGEMFTMAPDGSNVTLIEGVVVAPPYGWAWNPVKQPSSKFASVGGYITYGDRSEIWALDPNHPSNRISLGPSNGMMPIAWSRDGSRLLLMEQRTVGMDPYIWKDLYVMNADGLRKRLTTDGLSGEGTFSPDGTQVAFARLGDGLDAGLYAVDVRGGTPQLIAKSRNSWWLGSPAWSPDGSRIAYTVYVEFGSKGPAFEIWTVKPDGSDARQLVDLGLCGAGGCTAGLAWSPDGSTLAFHSRRGWLVGQPATQVMAIYFVRADGSGLRRISDDGTEPSWSPDGSRLAFIRGGEVFTMTPDGRNVTLVGGGGFVASSNGPVAWNPAT